MDEAKVSILCTVLSLTFAALGYLVAYLTFQRNKKKDDTAEGQNKGEMMSDIRYIKAGVDDLKRETADQRKTVNELGERVSRIEESAKQAHKRIDGIENKTH